MEKQLEIEGTDSSRITNAFKGSSDTGIELLMKL